MKAINLIIQNWDSIVAAVAMISSGLLAISEVLGLSKKTKYNGILHFFAEKTKKNV